MQLFSPAKINLFLRILRKRGDGYHDLASFFQAIGLGDTLTFSFAKEDEVSTSHPELPVDARNIITKALHLFRRKTNIKKCFKITCDKRIPIGAGLGGGSSNGATALYGLNLLSGSPVREKELQEWSLELGSDVPFFFSSGSACCFGRGEQVESSAALKQAWPLWLIVPPWGMSTPAVYKKLDLSTCSQEMPRQIYKRLLKGEKVFINDLEKPAFTLEPKLAILQEKIIAQGFENLFLTGSGSGLIVCAKEAPKLSSDMRILPISFCNRAGNGWYKPHLS